MDSSFESIIGKAILEGTDEARLEAENKATLKMLVMQKMFCEKSGKVLDQGDAIALEIRFTNGNTNFIGPFHSSVCREPEKTLADLEASSERMPTVREVRLLNGSELFPS